MMRYRTLPVHDRSSRGRQWSAPIALLFVVVLSLFSNSASATPPDVFGYGPRTQGMGMTGTSFASNYEAAWANPAGFAAQRRLGFTVGMQAGSFELKLDNEPWPLDAYQGMTLGLYLPLPFGGVLEDTFVVGAGFYTPSATVLRTDIIFPSEPNFILLARTQSVHVQLGLGINLDRLIPGLRIGVGVAALAQIGGRLRVALEDGGQFVSETETQLLASFNPLVGVQYDVNENFTLGLVWRDRIQSDIDLNIDVEGLPLALPQITITAVPQFDPHTIAFEGSYRLGNQWLFALQASYQRWSDYPGVVGLSTEHSDQPPAPRFRDTITPRLGIEWQGRRRRTTLQLRGGYAFQMSPARPAHEGVTRDNEGNPLIENGEEVTEPLRYLDNHRHMITAGSSVVWHTSAGAVISLDLFAQLHLLQEREHDIAQEGRTQNMITQGYILAGGWGLNFEW